MIKRLKMLWLYFRLGLLFRQVPLEEARQAILAAMLIDALEKYSRKLRKK